jgi:putative transposase
MSSHPRSFSRTEIEQIVIMFRLHLYNNGLHYGPQAIQNEMKREAIFPLPSISTIKRILSRNCLTHRRTGYYPEDHEPNTMK